MKLFSHASPIFRVSDVLATAEYYRDKLGFTIDFQWENPPSYIVLHRDEIAIHLAESSNVVPLSPFPALYVFVHDVDHIYEEYASRGVQIVGPISDTDYQMREFMIEDINGTRLMIGKGI